VAFGLEKAPLTERRELAGGIRGGARSRLDRLTIDHL